MNFSVTIDGKEPRERITIIPISKEEIVIRVCDPGICVNATVNKQELEKAMNDIMSVYLSYG